MVGRTFKAHLLLSIVSKQYSTCSSSNSTEPNLAI